MRLNNQQTHSRRRRIAAAARADHAAKTPVAEYAPPTPVDVSAETLPAGIAHERRGLGRVPMQSEIIVRRIGGFNFEVGLRDMSAHGCQIELIEACEVGDAIIARFPQLEPLGSRVCWTRGTTTGIEFQTKIHPAVFDHLLGRLDMATAA
jgi:hypothetical protein